MSETGASYNYLRFKPEFSALDDLTGPAPGSDASLDAQEAAQRETAAESSEGRACGQQDQ